MNITPPVYVNVIDNEEDLVESSELFSRIGFLLISILGGAFIGAFLALMAWLLVKKLVRKGKCLWDFRM
jgi:NhaP-type Na+/H+ or K+/H+ antiporter